MQVILTDARGKPLPRPERPPRGASTSDHIAYLREVHSFNDRVADIGTKAFADMFRVRIQG